MEVGKGWRYSWTSLGVAATGIVASREQSECDKQTPPWHTGKRKGKDLRGGRNAQPLAIRSTAESGRANGGCERFTEGRRPGLSPGLRGSVDWGRGGYGEQPIKLRGGFWGP